MKLRISIRDKLDAVSIVVSAILAVSIVIIAGISTIFWGIPYINELRNKESLESIEKQFNFIVDNFKDIIIGNSNDKNVLTLNVNEGSISIDKSNYDRTILIYSNSANLNFSVTDLEDKDNKFTLNIYNGTVEKVHIFPINEDGEIGSEIGSQFIPPLITLNSSIFEDRMVIYLNKSSDNGEELEGKIWLFDSDSLIYKLNSNTGNYKLFLEKGGIIYINHGNSQVKRLFNVYFKDKTFGLHVLQTVALKSFSVSGNGFDVKINIKGLGTWVQETDFIYNLRLQLYGDNTQIWLDYINKKYEKKFVISDNTLFLSESCDGVQLTFLNSIIDIDKV